MDWATAKTKAEAPKPPETTWKEVINQITEYSKDKKLLDTWSSYVLRKGDDGFEEDLAFIACIDYLKSWQNKNYGKMSTYLSSMIASNHGNAMPKIVREDYAAYPLEKFDILALNHAAAALCEIEVMIKVANKDEQTATLRWLYEGTEGEHTMLPKGNGEWRLMSWGVTTFLN